MRNFSMRPVRSAVASAVLLTLAACAVGPDYRKPDTDVPAAYTSDAQRIATSAAGASEPARVTRRRSPLYRHRTPTRRSGSASRIRCSTNSCTRALRENHDLRIALARFDEANALLRESRFDYLPTVTASADASDARSSVDQMAGVGRPDRDIESYAVRAVASWELDVFGRVRRNVESQRADTAATAADLAAAQVAIVGEVARSYLELRGLQERLRIARSNADNQRETLAHRADAS